MILDTMGSLATMATVTNGEGVRVPSFVMYRPFVSVSVQPAKLSQDERTRHGVKGNPLHVYCYLDTSISDGMRFMHGGKTYDVKGVCHWRIHTVFIADPVSGTL